MRSISQAEGRVKALMLVAFVHSDSDRKFGSWTYCWRVSTRPIPSQLGKLSAPLYMDIHRHLPLVARLRWRSLYHGQR